MKKLAILGSGDIAYRIAHLSNQTKEFELIGFIDKCKTSKNCTPLIGTDDDVTRLYDTGIIDCISIGVGYIQFPLRQKLYERFKGRVPLATIIHPSSYIDESANIGEGCVLFPSCSIGMYVFLNDNVLINTAAVICHESEIGSHTYISPNCSIAGHVSIGKRCMIGIGTTIINNINICDDVTTGGSSTVIKHISEHGTYVGSPARKIK